MGFVFISPRMRIRRRRAASAFASRQGGLTLLELIGVIALGAGLMTTVNFVLRDMERDAASISVVRYHQVLADASARYLSDNWAQILSHPQIQADLTLRIPMADLRAVTVLGSNPPPGQPIRGQLPAWWSLQNPVGQTACLHVRRNGSGGLQALLMTEGGRPMKVDEYVVAASVQGHGAGVLELPSTTGGPANAPLEARGLYGQWRLDFTTVLTQGFQNTNCAGTTPLRQGYLATWVRVRNPASSTSGAAQVIMRKQANDSALTRMVGTLGLHRPDSGATVVSSEFVASSPPREGDTCPSDTRGEAAPDVTGRILICRISSGSNSRWEAAQSSSQTPVSTLVGQVSAAQFSMMKVVEPDASCANYMPGELARVEDGALAYCAREDVAHPSTQWRWRKVGGKWKYTAVSNSTALGTTISINETPISNSGAVFPSTSRAVQIQVFLDEVVSSWNPRGEVYATVRDSARIGSPAMTMAKSCCGRATYVPFMTMPPRSNILYRVYGGSSLWVYPLGYIEDDFSQ